MDRFFGLDTAPKRDDVKHLVSVTDHIYLAILEGILEENDIPYLTKDRGCGSVLKVVAGFSMFGADIFVLERDYDKALALIETMPTEKEYKNAEIVPDDSGEEEENI